MLIVIDPIRKLYKRFVGHTCTHKAEADTHLTAGEVEQFRVNPNSAIVEESDAPKAS